MVQVAQGINLARSFFDPKLKAIIWEVAGSIDNKEFMETATKANQLRRKYFANKQLNNFKNISIFSKDVQEWIETKWIPDARSFGLRYFAYVIPKDSFDILSLNTEKNNAIDLFGIRMEYFDNEQDAINWLSTCN